MSHFIGKSGLTLPEETGALTNKCEMSLPALQQWLNQLPLSDLSETAKRLYIILQDSHQANISSELRFEILSFLKPTLDYLSEEIQKFYTSQEILSASESLTVDLIYALYIEMINGYKLVIEDTVQTFFCNKKMLLKAIQNAMHYGIKILFDSYTQHHNPPPGIWLDLHSLFILAQQKKFEKKPLFNEKESSKLNTLGDMYKHCLLFAIAHPFRLRRDEIIHLIPAIEEWAPLLTLQKTTNNKNSFVVDIQSDTGPKNTLYFKPSQEAYYLVMDKINERLNNLLSLDRTVNNQSSTSLSVQELALSSGLLELLINSWVSPGEVNRGRQKAQGKISVCLGINAIQWQISNSRLSSLTMFNNVINTKSVTEKENMDTLPINQPENEKTAKNATFNCELIDQSEGGYCLKWLQDIPPNLQCGEIIGLEKEANPPKAWSIGTIRWIKSEEDYSILLGIQVLGIESIAVKTRLEKDTDATFLPAILLANPSNQKKPMTLITPPLYFNSNLNVIIEFDGKNYLACLQKDHSQSPTYQEYELRFLDQPIVFPYQANAQQIQPAINPTTIKNKK